MHSANRLLPLSSISPTARDGQALRRAGAERVNSGQHPCWQASLSSVSLFFIFYFFLSFWESPALGEGEMVRPKSGGLGVGDRILLVQAHGRALVHAHVGITQQASGLTLDAFGIQGVQLLWRHFQVGLHLWTGGHLGDVKSILPSCKATCTISRKQADNFCSDATVTVSLIHNVFS